MRSGFARLHPLVDLTFFVLVLAFAMFLSHPAVQLAGLVCAALFALRCTGRGFGRRMAMLLPLMLLAAVVNPLVSHQGVTVLFRFPSGNACTLESVLYGISAAVRLGVLAARGGIVLAGSLTGGLKWWYYPAPGGATGVQAALWTAAFVLLAAFPLIFDAKEAIQWRASRSRT